MFTVFRGKCLVKNVHVAEFLERSLTFDVRAETVDLLIFYQAAAVARSIR